MAPNSQEFELLAPQVEIVPAREVAHDDGRMSGATRPFAPDPEVATVPEES